MKKNILARPRANSWLTHPVKRFLCAAAFTALFCASIAPPLQAATPPTLYWGYDGTGLLNQAFEWGNSASGAFTNTGWPNYWSSTPGGPIDSVWTNGDYAYFGITGIIVPENIQVDPAGVDTPGITVANASSDFGLTQPTGSTI